MNKKDQLLVRVLEKEGKLSSRQLAMKAMLPISTVHRRVRNLERQGVIKGYRAIIDYEKTDRPIPTLVFINISEANKKEKYAPIQQVKGQIFNVGSDLFNYRLIDVGETIRTYIPSKMEILKQEVDKRNYMVSFEKIKKTLNFHAMTSLVLGCNEIKKFIEIERLGD